MAVAGFSEDDLEVQVKEGILSIKSKHDDQKQAEKEESYVHRGIAKRVFERNWTLSDDVIVRGCELINGLLTVELERVVPDEKKPRIIPIGNKIKSIN